MEPVRLSARAGQGGQGGLLWAGSAPSSCWMCSRGLAMVALATMNCGARRYSRWHTRRSRRSTSAAWQPNTPRYACPLVHHHVAQVGQEAPKLAVHGQHAAVEHVGVGDQQVRPVPDLRPIILRTQTTALLLLSPVCPAWVASSAVRACLSLQDERHPTCMTPQCLCAMHSSPRQNSIVLCFSTDPVAGCFGRASLSRCLHRRCRCKGRARQMWSRTAPGGRAAGPGRGPWWGTCTAQLTWGPWPAPPGWAGCSTKTCHWLWLCTLQHACLHVRTPFISDYWQGA